MALSSISSQLACQADEWAEQDTKYRGIWKMVGDALTINNMFRVGWLLACIGNEHAREMFRLIDDNLKKIMEEL